MVTLLAMWISILVNGKSCVKRSANFMALDIYLSRFLVPHGHLLQQVSDMVSISQEILGLLPWVQSSSGAMFLTPVYCPSDIRLDILISLQQHQKCNLRDIGWTSYDYIPLMQQFINSSPRIIKHGGWDPTPSVITKRTNPHTPPLLKLAKGEVSNVIGSHFFARRPLSFDA